MTADAFTLPPLRADLQMFRAPRAADGSSEFTLFDAVTGRYKRIGWAEATLLAQWRPGLSIDEFLARIHQYTTLRTDERELLEFCRSVHERGLTAISQRKSAARLRVESEATRQGPVKWLLSHYLFIRVPLLYPDMLLEKTLSAARLLVSRGMLALYALTALLGLILVAGRVETYVYTFPDFFSPGGALAYGLTLIVVKAIHEFAHAYTAKAFGARVRSMGVVFIIFWPVPYSDVTDAWRLSTRWQRFLIGFAGIAAETVLAGVTLFGWCVAPEGAWKDIFFLTSSVTLVSTWLVNINPAMRFDGYYLLSDAWGVENLQPRAFALTKWWLRKTLLGLRVVPPEPVPHRRRMTGFIVYSIYAWCYRVGLYVGIALILYHRFWKFLGIFLFAMELYSFLVKPVCREAAMLWKLRGHIRLNPRSVSTAIVVTLAVLWLCLPLPRRMSVPAVVIPVDEQIVYAPHAGILQDLTLRRGDPVKRGQLVCRVESAELQSEAESLRRELLALEAERRAALVEEKQADRLPEIVEEIGRLRAELSIIREERKRARVTASVDGIVLEWREGIVNGVAVPDKAQLGRIVNASAVRVIAYVGEQQLGELDRTASASFVCATGSGELARGALSEIRPQPVAALDYEQLSTYAGGDIAVRPDARGRLVPTSSLYRIDLPPTTTLTIAPGTTGTLRLTTTPKSHLAGFLEHAWSIVLRESGF